MKESHSGLVVGIDASNIRSGGGFNHLFQLFNGLSGQPEGIDRIVIWAHQKMADLLKPVPWLLVKVPPPLSSNFLRRLIWQHFELPWELKSEGCDILFAPGGNAPLMNRIPYIVMSQNMLPFEEKEYRRYPLLSFQRLRLTLLRFGQTRSFANATGLIFLSQYAKEHILRSIGRTPKELAMIPHGIDARFFCRPTHFKWLAKHLQAHLSLDY